MRQGTGDEERALRRLIDQPTDEAAARVVVDRVVPHLAGFLRARFPSLAPEDAADLAGEALAQALERRDAFDPERGAEARTWVHGIAKLRAQDFLRKRGRDVPLEAAATRQAEGLPEPAPPEADPALRRKVREAIFALPEQQRRAAVAHFLEGVAPRDVDDLYGWRPNTANVYLSHARRTLRRQLTEAPTMAYGGCRSRARLRVRRPLVMGYAAAA